MAFYIFMIAWRHKGVTHDNRHFTIFDDGNVPQLNQHIRGSTKNSFRMIVFHYLNNQYPISHFIAYGCRNVTNYCWASTKVAFCCLEACPQFAQSKLTSMASFAREKMCELGASKMWANSKQAQPEQGHWKWALVSEVPSSKYLAVLLSSDISCPPPPPPPPPYPQL